MYDELIEAGIPKNKAKDKIANKFSFSFEKVRDTLTQRNNEIKEQRKHEIDSLK
jgi:hypothetical protein